MPTAACKQRGFTLIELLVALAVMALMTVLSWRGLDGMTRSQTQTQAHSTAVLTLQTALAQWTADLDALAQNAQIEALDWDGLVLRMTRRSTAQDLLVVAWSQRSVDGTTQWLRWQSPPLRSRKEWQEAWSLAMLWGRNQSDEMKKSEVAITALAQWQIFYFRGETWSNPLSSNDSSTSPGTNPAQTQPVASVPEGVRLVLTLPSGQALSGTLTRDWVRTTGSGAKL